MFVCINSRHNNTNNTWNFFFEFSWHYRHYYLFLNVLLQLEPSIFQLCNLIGLSSGNADVGCLTEQLGRHFWQLTKASSSSDTQPPYLAPLSLAWRQARIISSTWDRKPWGAASSGDLFFCCCFSGSWSLCLSCCCNCIPSPIQHGSKCEEVRFGGGRRQRKGEVSWGSRWDSRVGGVQCTFSRVEGLPTMFLYLSQAVLVYCWVRLSKGKEIEVHPSPRLSHLPAPMCSLNFPLAPCSYKLVCMLQGCQHCREEEGELTLKKVALNQTV